jgi:hypothetical protein
MKDVDKIETMLKIDINKNIDTVQNVAFNLIKCNILDGIRSPYSSSKTFTLGIKRL